MDSECLQKDWPLLENLSLVSEKKSKKTVDTVNLLFVSGKSDDFFY